MKLSNKLLLPALALNLVSLSAFATKAPEIVADLWTNKQTALVAATATAFFGAMAWAINQDINDEIAREERKHHKKVEVNLFKKYALVALPSAVCAGFIGAAVYLGITFENIDQYLKDSAKLNDAIAKTTQEILLGVGI